MNSGPDGCESCGGPLGAEPLGVFYRERHRTFCTFLCAIRSLAPVCAGCGDILLGRSHAEGGRRTCAACAAAP